MQVVDVLHPGRANVSKVFFFFDFFVIAEFVKLLFFFTEADE